MRICEEGQLMRNEHDDLDDQVSHGEHVELDGLQCDQ